MHGPEREGTECCNGENRTVAVGMLWIDIVRTLCIAADIEFQKSGSHRTARAPRDHNATHVAALFAATDTDKQMGGYLYENEQRMS